MIKNNIIKHTDHLQAEVRENIGLIAFNRPESKNALSDELTPALRTTLENFESDKNVRVIVITCLLYTSPSPRDRTRSRMPSSA